MSSSLLMLSYTCFTDNEDLLGRTTLVGIVLAFRKLTLDALHNVSCYWIVQWFYVYVICVLLNQFCLFVACVCSIRVLEYFQYSTNFWWEKLQLMTRLNNHIYFYQLKLGLLSLYNVFNHLSYEHSDWSKILLLVHHQIL